MPTHLFKKGQPTSQISLLVRCVLCGEGLRYQRDDTGCPIFHLQSCHPGVTMASLPCEVQRNPLKDNANKVTSEGDGTADGTAEKKNKLFKTTVETWRPGPSKITCPSCGKTEPPVIRRQRTQVSRSQLAAMCLVGCWPICFLPCMMANNPSVDLHCCYCHRYFGSYNSKLKLITPSDKSEPEKCEVDIPVGECPPTCPDNASGDCPCN